MKLYLTFIAIALYITIPIIQKDLEGEFAALKIQYPKLTQEIYRLIKTECYPYKIEVSDICAIIQAESEFNPNAIHENIRDGRVVSIDRGLCQINSCHGVYDTIEKNIEKGVYEYALCLAHAKGDKKVANRYYNAGRNNRAENYKNWAYVKNIDKDRQESLLIEKYYFSEK